MRSILAIPSSGYAKTLEIPFSKSYLNRLLILAASDKNEVLIKGNSEALDVFYLKEALRKVGLLINEDQYSITVKNSFPDCELSDTSFVIDVGEGGSTFRFLLALLLKGKKQYKLKLSKSLIARPQLYFYQVLESLGAKIDFNEALGILTLQGPIKIEDQLIVDCHETTQFASSLMLNFPKEMSKIETSNLKTSHTYLKLTEKCIREANNRKYQASLDIACASYPLALVMLHGEVEIKNFYENDPLQADHHIITILENLGGKFFWNKSSLKFKGNPNYSGFDFDASDAIDLIPTLCFLASYAKSPSHFSNLKNLKFKESNRLEEILNLLQLFEVKFRYNDLSDELTIEGNAKRNGEKLVFTAPDHRMVMTAYLFLKHNHGGKLDHQEAVNKSFPHFFKVME